MSDDTEITRHPFQVEGNRLPELNDETKYCIRKVTELGKQLEQLEIDPVYISDALIEVSKHYTDRIVKEADELFEKVLNQFEEDQSH